MRVARGIPMSRIARTSLTLVISLILVIPSLAGALSAADPQEAPPVLNLGRGSYETISLAVEEAKEGDVIFVGPGLYDEPVLIDKSLTLIGSGDETMVSSTVFVTSAGTISSTDFSNILNVNDWNAAAGVTTMWFPYVNSQSTPITGVKIQSCTFTNVQHGVYFFGAQDCSVVDSTFKDCYRGVSIQNHVINNVVFRAGGRITVENCTFTDLKPLNNNDGEAVAVHDTDYNVIKDITVDGANFGVMIYKGEYNSITGSEFSNVTKDVLYLDTITRKVTVKDNIIRDSGGGVYFTGCRGFEFTGNSIENCSDDIRIDKSSTFTFSGNSINGSSVHLIESNGGVFASNDFATSSAPTFEFTAPSKVHHSHSIATSNTVGGNPIQYYYNQAGLTVSDTTAGSVMFAYSNNPTVSNTTVVDGDGIRLVNSPGSVITANVTNNLYGIDVVDSGSGRLDGCIINTSDRGEHGIRLLDSVSTDTLNSQIKIKGRTPAWKIEGGDPYKAYNTTFPYGSVEAKADGGGELWVYSALSVKVMRNETLTPLTGVEVDLAEDTSVAYRTPHYGGADAVSDVDGMIGPVTLLDRTYKQSSIPTELKHDLDLWFQEDAIWSIAIHDLNMSEDMFIVVETTDVWKPAMPWNFTITDIPAEDALRATWDLNIDDTEVYSIWSNMSGDWVLLENLSAISDNYRIDDGLVHNDSYYFILSAWDEIPLESDRTDVMMVTHVDGLAPAMVTGLASSNVLGRNFTLGWNTNLDSDLEGYRVYINSSGGDENGPWDLLTSSSGFMDTELWIEGLVSETTYYLIVTAVDERPNESPFSVALSVTTADITPPDAPFLAAMVELTNIVDHTVSGTAEPGSTVTLLMNGEIAGTAVADNDGDFSTLLSLDSGLNVITAFATDIAGNRGLISASVEVFLDDIAPDAPVLDQLSALTNVVDHTAAGTAEAGSTVTIVLNGEVVGTVVAETDGTFELPISLVEGSNTLTAFSTDPALNEGPQATVQTVILDTIAPDIPDLDPTPEYTNQASFVLTGIAEPNSTVEVMLGTTAVASGTAEADGSYSITIALSDRMTTITVRATDVVGNVGQEGTERSIILDQEEPVAVAGEDAEVVEDTLVGFDASASTDNEAIDSYEWTFVVDGTPETLDGLTSAYTFPDVTTLTVTLTVTDMAGNTGTDTLELTIIASNLPPTLRNGGADPGKGDTGTKFTFTVEFKDPDDDSGEVLVYIDGESFLMSPDPDDTDPTNGITYIYETKLSKGDHTYYFEGSDSFGHDAEGPSAGEDNAMSSPTIKKKTSDSPGFGLIMVMVALLVLVALGRVRGRREE
jgi:YD repeat-containing protein